MEGNNMKKKLISILLFIFIFLNLQNINAMNVPELEISNIEGGIFNIHIQIKNVGNTDAINVEWNITILGGLLAPSSRQSSNSNLIIKSNDSIHIMSSLLLGFGKITATIKVKADDVNEISKTIDAFVLGFYVILLEN
jgi:hypothetical protein